jgi:hypothetical protein
MSRRLLALTLLALGGLSALGFGLYGLLSPAGTAAAVSLEAQNAFGRGEIRALYGGMWTAMGILVLGALRTLALRGAPRPAVDTRATERIRTIAWCWTGVPLARSLALLLEGSDGGPAGLFILAEVAMVATLLGGLALLPARRA